MANDISKLITPDGVSHDIADAVARQASYDVSNKVNKTGDTMTGSLKIESASNASLIFKESGYGDKFEIKPSFGGTGNTNYLAIKTATGDAGTDPDTTEKIRIRPSGQVEFLSNVNLYGYDLKLLTPSSSSNDSSDILYCYGNGAEKARIWVDNSPTDKTSGRLLVRAYKSDGTQIYSDRIPLLSDVTDRVARAGDTMSGQLSFSNTSRNIQIPARSTSYVDGAKGNAGVYMPHTYNKDEWGPILCVQNKAGGSWSVGSYNGEDLEFVNFTKANIDSSTNTAACNWKLNPTNGFMGPWNGIIDDHNTNNTSDTWIPVFNGAKMQHRVLSTSYNGKSVVGATSSVHNLPSWSNDVIPSTQYLAYWNGAYNSSGNSNIQYCDRGRLGTIVTSGGTSQVSYNRVNGNVSNDAKCWRFGNVVVFTGYFGCSVSNLAKGTQLWNGFPKPKCDTYFHARCEGNRTSYDFYINVNGVICTNQANIPAGTYLVNVTWIC